MTVRIFMLLGGLSGFCGVVLGALSAHALRHRLDAAALTNLDTAARYLLVHGLLLVVIAAWSRIEPDLPQLRVAGASIALGIVLFCGSVSIANLTGLRGLTAVAPAGGIALMVGWLTLAVTALWKL